MYLLASTPLRLNSHRRLTVPGALLLSSCSSLLACGQRSADDFEPLGLSIAEVSITEGQVVETEPGVGAGLFVSTTAQGQWRLTTSCDTQLTGFGCDWDVILSVPPGERLVDVGIADGEAFDAVYRIDSGAFQWLTLTGRDFDALDFTAEPGQVVRLDVLLDGVSAPSFIYWSFDGYVVAGAPSDPVDFVPVP